MSSAMVVIIFFAIFVGYCNAENKQEKKIDTKEMNYEINKSDVEWKQVLSPDEFHVLRNKGTERPFTGKYNSHFESGIYSCKACGNPLFESDTKFESHCGWPSFFKVKDKSAIKEIRDTSHGMIRTEIVCSKCGGHLGHVFDDGPNPTGLRYCINSVSIDFKSTKEENNGKK
jgi:peptide-methionine (R)-S-oxide reductase